MVAVGLPQLPQKLGMPGALQSLLPLVQSRLLEPLPPDVKAAQKEVGEIRFLIALRRLEKTLGGLFLFAFGVVDLRHLDQIEGRVAALQELLQGGLGLLDVSQALHHQEVIVENLQISLSLGESQVHEPFRPGKASPEKAGPGGLGDELGGGGWIEDDRPQHLGEGRPAWNLSFPVPGGKVDEIGMDEAAENFQHLAKLRVTEGNPDELPRRPGEKPATGLATAERRLEP